MKDMKKLIVALALIVSAPAYAQTRRAMTIDDVLDLVQVSFREPAHQRIRDAEEISWLMKYTWPGVEGAPADRQEGRAQDDDAVAPATRSASCNGRATASAR